MIFTIFIHIIKFNFVNQRVESHPTELSIAIYGTQSDWSGLTGDWIEFGWK